MLELILHQDKEL